MYKGCWVGSGRWPATAALLPLVVVVVFFAFSTSHLRYLILQKYISLRFSISSSLLSKRHNDRRTDALHRRRDATKTSDHGFQPWLAGWM